MIWLVRLGIIAALLAAAYFIGRCGGDDFNPDQPPEVIDSLDVEDGLVSEPPSVLERIYIRELQPVRSGSAPGVVKEEVQAFAAAVTKPAAGKKPVYPPVRGEWADGRLTLAVGRSDGALVRNEYECPDPCRFYTQDTLMGAETTRAIPRLFPQVLEGAATCAAVAAAGYGVAYLVEYEEPALAAGVAGGACAIVKVF